jgi:predicted PurR-regulated permease PerM
MLLEINKKTLQRIFLGAAGCILLYWLLHETDRVKSFFGVVSDIAAPFVIGGVLAFILNVPMRGIENALFGKIKKSKLKRALAIVLTLLGLLLVIAAVFWLLIPQIIKTVNSLIPNLSVFLSAAQQKVNAFLSDNPHLMGWIKNNTDISTVSWATMAEKALSMFGNSVSTIIAGAVTAIGGVFSTVFNCMIAGVFSVYCLSQK